MIRRKDEIRVREVKNAQGGNGSVFFHDWLLPEEAPGHGRVFSKIVLPPGSSIGYHEHQGEFEAYLVAAGSGRVIDGDKEEKLYAGDMHICKSGSGHMTENTGNEDLVLYALIMNDLS